MSYKAALQDFGLSESEASVYVALLKLGESSAQAIAKHSGLQRTTTYNILENLMQKELVNFIIKEKVKHFQANKPKYLLTILDEKRQYVLQALPELEALQKTFEKRPSVRLFEGVKGIKTILGYVLEEKQMIYHYGDICSLQTALPYVFQHYISKRVAKKIPIRIIGQRKNAHDALIKTSKDEFREFVFIPDGYAFPSSIFIFSKKVAMLSLQKEPYYGIIVDDVDFYVTQKNFFELLWKGFHGQ